MKLISSFTAALFILLIIGQFAPTIGQQNIVESKLEQFLINALEEFPLWVHNNNLDPSPPNAEKTYFNVIEDTNHNQNTWNLTVLIKDEQVSGLSRLSEGWHSIQSPVYMDTGSIKMSFETTMPILFQGSYTVTGTINNSPVTEQGKWSWKLENVITKNLYYDFEISTEGYVNLYDLPTSGVLLETEFANITLDFHDVLEGEDDQAGSIIWETLSHKLDYHYKYIYPGHPICNLEYRYFTQLLQKITLDQIINGPVNSSQITMTNLPINQLGNMELKFQNFLRNALELLPAWVRNNNLDPSLPNPKKNHFTEKPENFHFEIILKDEQVFGLGTPSQDQRSTWSYVNMEHGIILLAFDTIVPISFKGNYSLMGWLLDFKLPSIVSEGEWSYTIAKLATENLCFNFKITSDGYIEISEYPFCYQFQTRFANTSFHFQDLLGSKNGSEGPVFRKALLNAVKLHYSDCYRDLPTFHLEHRYFTDLFRKTPLEEILFDTYQVTKLTNRLSTLNQSQPNTTDEILFNFGTAISPQTINETNFQQFLKNAIEKFPTWIHNNNLDPTSPNPEKYYFDWLYDSSRLNISIHNEHSVGLSRPSKGKRSIWSYVNIKQGIIAMVFDVIVPISFQGNFSANGTLNDILFTGEGDWLYKIGNTTQISFYNFIITSQGSVKISEYPILQRLQTNFSDTSISSNVDLKNGDEKDMEIALLDTVYNHYSNFYPGHPVFTLEHRYFTELFQKTTLEEIISATCRIHVLPFLFPTLLLSICVWNIQATAIF